MEEKKLSEIVYIILCLVIFRHAIHIFQCLALISFAPTEAICDIVLSILMIVAFGVVQVANVIGQTILGNNFVSSLLVALVSCAILFIVLQIRKNGLSAWKVLFGKESVVESVDETSIEKQE